MRKLREIYCYSQSPVSGPYCAWKHSPYIPSAREARTNRSAYSYRIAILSTDLLLHILKSGYWVYDCTIAHSLVGIDATSRFIRFNRVTIPLHWFVRPAPCYVSQKAPWDIPLLTGGVEFELLECIHALLAARCPRLKSRLEPSCTRSVCYNITEYLKSEIPTLEVRQSGLPIPTQP